MGRSITGSTFKVGKLKRSTYILKRKESILSSLAFASNTDERMAELHPGTFEVMYY